MQIKQKMCAGWDLKPHSAFIWKKINGKLYCKFCSLKLEGIKFISKISTKQKVKKVLKANNTNLRHKMFLNIWSKLQNKNCWSCGKYLGEEPLSLFFDHLIEKSTNSELDLTEKNIYICCADCHEQKTKGFPTENHKKAIEEAKNKLL